MTKSLHIVLADLGLEIPKLEELFIYNGAGTMPGRTWVIAPDAESLEKRWHKLSSAPADQKETLFHPHLRGGAVGDKHSQKVVGTPLHGFAREQNRQQMTAASPQSGTGALRLPCIRPAIDYP
jgi:hypothetical protein